MNQHIAAIFILFSSVLMSFGQGVEYTAPVKWEAYSDKKARFSILLPKLPVVTRGTNACSETETSNYVAYAEEVVYKVTVSMRTKKKAPAWCQPGDRFGKNTFINRLAEIRTANDSAGETKYLKDGMEVSKIAGKYNTHWLYDDAAKEKIVELTMTHRADVKPDELRFVDSLTFDPKSGGKEIGDGAERTFGDESAADKEKTDAPESEKLTEENSFPFIVQFKPKPSYTDSARQNKVQGRLQLRVTFLANGGIGSISAVTELPQGLTEQAIMAAQKIVFIPAKRKGVNVNMTKLVEYSFTIY